MCRYNLSFIVFALFGLTTYAQKDTLSLAYDTTEINPKKISENDLETYLNDPKFDYSEITSSSPDWWISFKNWISNIFLRFFEWIFGIEKASGAFNVFLKILPYLLLVVLLFILIKFFINVNARSVLFAKKNQSIVALSEDEHIIKNEDIQILIKNALLNSDYRLAIRYYYLYILQIMTKENIIVWEQQKTNEDYIVEIEEAHIRTSFTTLTRLYDYIWYGNFPLDKLKFEKAESKFLALKNILLDA